MKLGWNESYYEFNPDGVTGYAPNTSGLYALFTWDKKTCLRVVTSRDNDLRQTLSGLASRTAVGAIPGDQTLSRAKWYQYEPVLPSLTSARLQEAKAELQPEEG